MKKEMEENDGDLPIGRLDRSRQFWTAKHVLIWSHNGGRVLSIASSPTNLWSFVQASCKGGPWASGKNKP